MSIRSWSIRAKISVLVVPPILALIAFWLIGTTLSAASSINLLNAEAADSAVVAPGRALIRELQEERRLSAAVLAGQAADRTAQLSEQRVRTDSAAGTFRRLVTGQEARDSISARTSQRIDETLTALDGLGAARGAIDRREATQPQLMAAYGKVIESMFHTFQPLAELDDVDSMRLRRAVSGVAFAREILAREDAVAAAVGASGRFTAVDHGLLTQAIGAHRALLAEAPSELPDSERARYQALVAGPELTRLRGIEEKLLTEVRAGAPLPVPVTEWQAAYRGADEALQGFEEGIATALADRAGEVTSTYYWRLGVTAVFGLLAVLFSIAIAVRVGSSLIRRLRGLRGAALELAYHRLPDVVGRLRAGEDVNVPTEAPPLEFGGDEIGQVAHAFSDVQRTAVQSAVKEADLRRGLNEVFLNIARRSQTLLHRQLTLLDRMERRTTEPEELEDLFRVDHLATRMRRHAEDLVILAGATPGRGWRHPVPLVDVIRGAVSEVEDYARVKILATPDVALAGRAVTDLVHLLAELLENATSYSPPHTRVHVTGEMVPNGFAIEIEDRGLGMSPEEIDAANERLRQPPDFDPANSARLGLFVVALLAARLNIRVTLRSSPYGGVTAVALIPLELIEDVPPLALPGPDTPQLRAVPRPATPSRTAIGALPSVELTLTGTTVPASPTEPPHAAPVSETLPVMPAFTSHSAPRPAGAPPAGTPALDAQPGMELTPDGLPRRPRRRTATAEDSTVDSAESTQPLPPRPPEQMRAMMSAFQEGMARGRQNAEQQARRPDQQPPREA
jgi:signal transduction histidine kinase